MNNEIAIIGLGYVGLPLAIEFGKKFKTTGFDIDRKRIEELKIGIDKTNEVCKIQFDNACFISFSYNIEDIKKANIYIITVPTPIDKFNTPDLRPLLIASAMVGKLLKKNDIVIYESTVYPGCTEEDCVPVLEKESGLTYNKDFFCGYSPERINPGDKINTLVNIKKVTSGSNVEIANVVDELYKSIIVAGTHKAPNIKVAEASKAIENAQRDLNIAFVNELAMLFDKIGIDTKDVLDAASTKWNFLNYKPGLVGGHCIGVDPYYLSSKASSVGFHSNVILAGRRVNDGMGSFIANKILNLIVSKGLLNLDTKILILGVTFKENCSDIRNTKVLDIYKELIKYNLNVNIYDPIADKNEVNAELKINLVSNLDRYDCIILAVAHDIFLKSNLVDLKKSESSIIFDVKSVLNKSVIDARL
jgi:UDP-N-acetyl-D-galactosamine dehydrogenase